MEACVPVGLQFWTDGALFQNCCPETVVCGPGRIEEAHSDTEYIEAEQLEKACRMYIRTAYALCL
ncbi:acetylornithine deacetylase [compost metagenome]